MASALAVSPAAAFRAGSSKASRTGRRSVATRCSQQDPLLLRVARGEGAGHPAALDCSMHGLIWYHVATANASSTWFTELNRASVKVCWRYCCLPVARPACCLPLPAWRAEAERTPVWLMRQAGRYMAAFREYSDRIPFRERSETASIAIELSLQVGRGWPARCLHLPGGWAHLACCCRCAATLPLLGTTRWTVAGHGSHPACAPPRAPAALARLPARRRDHVLRHPHPAAGAGHRVRRHQGQGPPHRQPHQQVRQGWAAAWVMSRQCSMWAEPT